MTKQEFLEELENNIHGYLSKEDIQEIVSDYNDIFLQGQFEGKDEETISHELGSPAMISKRILSDEKNTENRTEGIGWGMDRKELSAKESKLAAMSKRLGAYIIDGISISIILTLLLIAFGTPYSSVTSVTQSRSVPAPSTVESKQEGLQEIPIHEYRERMTMNSEGDILKVELFEKNKRIFSGTEEESKIYKKENQIQDTQIATKEKVWKENWKEKMSGTSNILILMYGIIFLFFGVFNLITAFELWIFKGYTLGKWLLKIRVQRADGSRIGFWNAVLREAVIKSIGNGVTSGFLNIGSFIWACATRENKTVHDLAANTVVISMKR